MTKGIDKYSIDSTDYTIGQDNVQKWGFDVHNPVFGWSAGLIAAFLVFTLIMDGESAKAALDGIKWKIIGSFDWLFIWSGNIFVIFSGVYVCWNIVCVCIICIIPSWTCKTKGTTLIWH